VVIGKVFPPSKLPACLAGVGNLFIMTGGIKCEISRAGLMGVGRIFSMGAVVDFSRGGQKYFFVGGQQ